MRIGGFMQSLLRAARRFSPKFIVTLARRRYASAKGEGNPADAAMVFMGEGSFR